MNTEYSPLEELQNKCNHHRKFGRLNRIVGDWMNAISIMISVIIPGALLLKQHYSGDVQKDIDFYLVIVSTIGLLAVVVSSIFKFRQRSEKNFEIVFECEKLKRSFEARIINEVQLVSGINEISRDEIKEINYF